MTLFVLSMNMSIFNTVNVIVDFVPKCWSKCKSRPQEDCTASDARALLGVRNWKAADTRH